MKKNNLDFSTVQALHQAGQLVQAENGYLAILRKNPRDVETRHALGILYAQQKNFADAITQLKTAVQYQPNNSILQLHLANVLKAHGMLNEAATILETVVKENPGYVAALNNLGTIYYAQNNFSAALTAYQQVIAKEPEFIDAYYNLGLTLIKQNQFDQAAATYQTLLKYAPEHFAARFHLACTLLRQEKINDALTEFLVVEKNQPYHFETQSNIALCFLKKGLLDEAKKHYSKALELMPNDTQTLFNLGFIHTQQGDIDNGIQYYQKTAQINPDDFSAHNNLGVAFLAKQHVAFALHHFQEAARLQPNNQAIQYTVKMLSQNQRLLAAPTDYVKTLFDSYADHYEQHLLTALDYQIPNHILNAVLRTSYPAPAAWNILDLGCGTGLCGSVFKTYAKHLTGVDLSNKMLEVAAQKNIYNELVCDELIHFLEKQHDYYDLILAGDVLVYIGDLDNLFQHVAQALTTKGLFVFNAEISEHHDYKMNQSGRFSHQKKYLDELAKKHSFNITHYENVTTRLQNNIPVLGHLYVLCKT